MDRFYFLWLKLRVLEVGLYFGAYVGETSTEQGTDGQGGCSSHDRVAFLIAHKECIVI